MTGFWRSWMQAWCWMTVGFGVVFALVAFPATEGPARMFYDLIYWPLDGQAVFSEDTRLSAALLGAVMIGWAIAIFGLVEAADAVGASAWRWLTASITTWFVIDSTISVASGVALNALSNSVFLVTFLIPILGSGVLAGRNLKAA